MDGTLLKIQGLRKVFGESPVLDAVDLDVASGEFLTLLGPSGCGKTTLLRLIAGLEEPSAGSMTLAGEDLTAIPAEKRPVNTVFQSYALFPHLTVFDNVAFGPHLRGVRGDDLKRSVEEALETVGLGEFARRKPAQLSGGQQQRVAIARAVVNKPRVLLLDEPLSALDYKLRKRMQVELKQLQRRLGITFIFVTHDQEEALSMSDRIAVMREGRIAQLDTPRRIYEEPASIFVARFVGETNLLTATVKGREDDGLSLELEGITLKVRLPGFEVAEKVHVMLRPEDLDVLSRDELERHPEQRQRAIAAKVEEGIYKGSTVDMLARLDSGERIAATAFFNEENPSLDYHRDDEVFITWPRDWEVLLPWDAGDAGAG
jgi:spermidine/putrescine transport system ATP-binding protein